MIQIGPEEFTIGALVYSVVEIIGFIYAGHALLKARTPQGAIAWIISLIVVPFIAIPLYLVLKRHRFNGYLDALRSSDTPLAVLFRQKLDAMAATRQVARGDHRLTRFVERIGRMAITDQNHVQLLINGDETYTAIFEAIEQSRHYLLVEFFIVKNDGVGSQFIEALMKKAQQGVEVRFLYDEIGSRKLGKKTINKLREAGVDVRGFGSNRGRGNQLQINFRNHRKILVADGEIAFIGGLNIGDEYHNDSIPKFGKWRDTHLAIQGPSVSGVQLTFVSDWNWATSGIGDLPDLYWADQSSNLEADWSHKVGILASSPADRLDTCHLFFLESINSADERIWISSPYFVPDGAIIAALQAAAQRGVDVRILLPDRPDHLLVYLSSFSYLEEMSVAGVEVYRFTKGFLHQKALLVDDLISSVGTANLDNRSFRLNFEILAVIEDREFNQQVGAMLAADFDNARLVQPEEYLDRSLFFRIAVSLARLMSPVQ